MPKYDLFIERSWRNLSEQYLTAVRTSYHDELEGYIKNLGRGSVAIAGERGVGKTSLMLSATRMYDSDSREVLDVWISAPTAYDEKEFLFSALARVPLQIGLRLTDNPRFPNNAPTRLLQSSDSWRRKIRWAIPLGIVAAAVSILIPLPLAGKIALAVSIVPTPALLLLAVKLFGDLLLPAQPPGLVRREDRLIVRECESLLEELWFEHKDIASSSVNVSGLGLNMTGNKGRERTRLPFTLPQLISIWEDFIGRAATGPDGFRKVVIFIDEVDKADNISEMKKFMRILKSLFGPQNLFFVVSVAEDAYRQFSQRSTSPDRRDVFDSAFDQFMFLKPMSYDDTTKLINDRIIGEPLPWPFIQLIWTLSNGNPRDSVRMARDVVSQNQGDDLATVALKLVTEYELEPLLEESKRLLKDDQISKVTPEEFQKLEHITEEFQNALGLPSGSETKWLSSLQPFIHVKSKTLEDSGGEANIGPLPVLLKLRSGLFLGATIYRTFQKPQPEGPESFFQKAHTNGYLSQLSHARKLIRDRAPEYAWETLEHFQTEIKL